MSEWLPDAARSDGPEGEPWARDPDAWRGNGHDPGLLPLLAPWPQLDATPLYWMWCERFERERGIDRPDTP